MKKFLLFGSIFTILSSSSLVANTRDLHTEFNDNVCYSLDYVESYNEFGDQVFSIDHSQETPYIKNITHNLDELDSVGDQVFFIDHSQETPQIINITSVARSINEDDYSARNNYVILDDTINSSGRGWNQPNGYGFYRTFITNTTNQRMSITIEDATGSIHTGFSANANSSTTIYGNNVSPGRISVFFSTPNGVVTGTITTRVSTVPL